MSISISSVGMASVCIKNTENGEYQLDLSAWQVFVDFFRWIVGAETTQQKLINLHQQIYAESVSAEEILAAMTELVFCVKSRHQNNFRAEVIYGKDYFRSGEIEVEFYYDQHLIKKISGLAWSSRETVENCISSVVSKIGSDNPISDYSIFVYHDLLVELENIETKINSTEEFEWDNIVSALYLLYERVARFIDIYSVIENVYPFELEIAKNCEVNIDVLNEINFMGFSNVAKINKNIAAIREAVCLIHGDIHTNFLDDIYNNIKWYYQAKTCKEIFSQQCAIENIIHQLNYYEFMRDNSGGFDFSMWYKAGQVFGVPRETVNQQGNILVEADKIVFNHLNRGGMGLDAFFNGV